MQEIGDVKFGECRNLERPVLAEAYRWTLERLGPDGMLEKSEVSGPKLAPFIRHASLFEIILEDGKVQDYVACVLASHIADNLQEISGHRGSETLPPQLFERWRITGEHLMDKRACFRTRTHVYGKDNKKGESLIVPVTTDGNLTHALVFTEYWRIDPEA